MTVLPYKAVESRLRLLRNGIRNLKRMWRLPPNKAVAGLWLTVAGGTLMYRLKWLLVHCNTDKI